MMIICIINEWTDVTVMTYTRELGYAVIVPKQNR